MVRITNTSIIVNDIHIICMLNIWGQICLSNSLNIVNLANISFLISSPSLIATLFVIVLNLRSVLHILPIQ